MTVSHALTSSWSKYGVHVCVCVCRHPRGHVALRTLSLSRPVAKLVFVGCLFDLLMCHSSKKNMD